jgi:general secretion pathway protein H
MQTLATGKNRAIPRHAGFSLIEMLVVVAVVGLLSVVVVLTMPTSGGAAREDARRFAARAQVAAQESIISGKPIGLAVDDQAYRFYRFRNGEWQAADAAGPLVENHWDEDVSLSVQPPMPAKSDDPEERQQQPYVPGVIFNPIGAVTPFRVAVSAGSQRYIIASTPRGDITLEEQSDARR